MGTDLRSFEVWARSPMAPSGIWAIAQSLAKQGDLIAQSVATPEAQRAAPIAQSPTTQISQ